MDSLFILRFLSLIVKLVGYFKNRNTFYYIVKLYYKSCNISVPSSKVTVLKYLAKLPFQYYYYKQWPSRMLSICEYSFFSVKEQTTNPQKKSKDTTLPGKIQFYQDGRLRKVEKTAFLCVLRLGQLIHGLFKNSRAS